MPFTDWNVQPVQVPDFVGRRAKLLALDQERQVRDQQLSEGAIRLRALKQQEDDQLAQKRAMAAGVTPGRTATVNPGSVNVGGLDISQPSTRVNTPPAFDRLAALNNIGENRPDLYPGMQSQFQTQDLQAQELQAKTREAVSKASTEQLKQIQQQAATIGQYFQAVDSAPPEMKAQIYASARAHAIQAGVPGVENSPAQFDPNWYAQTRAASLTVEQAAKEEDARRTSAVTMRGQDMTAATAAAGQDVTKRGQDLTNARSKEANNLGEFRTMSAAEVGLAGLPKGTVAQTNGKGKIDILSRPGDKPPTEGERTAFSFYQRASDAAKRLDELEPSVLNAGNTGAMGRAVLPNALMSDVNQQYTQAQRQFTQAKLRRESGAAISQSEYEQDAKTYFPQVGDKPHTLQNKKLAREAVLRELKTASGRAYSETYGDSSGGGGNAGTVRMVAPNGEEQDVSPDQVAHYESLGAKRK